MVTDHQGMPLQIQVATPVKASRIQRAVYGQPLERTVTLDIVGTPLLNSIEFYPRVILTNRLLCLQAESRFPLLFIGRKPDINLAEGYETRPLGSSSTGSLMLVRKIEGNDTSLEEASRLVSRTREYFDAIEVFARIERALEVAADHDVRFE